MRVLCTEMFPAAVSYWPSCLWARAPPGPAKPSAAQWVILTARDEKVEAHGKLSVPSSPPTPPSVSATAHLRPSVEGRECTDGVKAFGLDVLIVGLCRQQPFLRTPSVRGQRGAKQWSRLALAPQPCTMKGVSLDRPTSAAPGGGAGTSHLSPGGRVPPSSSLPGLEILS